MKRSDTPRSSETPSFKFINGVHALTIHYSVLTGLILEILFMLFSVYKSNLKIKMR